MTPRPPPVELSNWALSVLAQGAAGRAPPLTAVAGDASNRRYFRAVIGGTRYILVDAPPATEKNQAFVAVRELLAGAGVRVPALHAVDFTRGYLALEDLGDRLLLAELGAGTVDAHYRAAMASLLQIEGIGSSELTIHGVPRLHGATYRVMSDRIEAGSYACAAAITGGEVLLKHAVIEEMEATVQALRSAGVHVEPRAEGLYVAADGPMRAVTLSTAPYPGFATDMQAQLMAMLCLAQGTSVLTETIFAWPGIGKWMVESISRRDYPAVQGGLLLIAAIVMIVNLLVDLLYGLINPRIRHTR